MLSFALFFACFAFADVNGQTVSDELYKSSAFTIPKGFIEIEGPAVDKDGNVYAVNFERKGTIGKVTPDGIASVFVELPAGSVGNGIRFDSRGNMFIADYTKHNILKVDMATKKISVFAHEPTMTQPNDIAIDSKDRLYASDPNFRGRKGRMWLVDKGKVTLLDSLDSPANGIEVSPDEKILYVAAARSIWAYDLSSKGMISNKRLLIEFADAAVMDGMRSDIDGNLYATRNGKGTVVKVSPQGKLLQEITLLARNPTNVAFGGKDGKTIYVTNSGQIESFRVDSPGREWKMQSKK